MVQSKRMQKVDVLKWFLVAILAILALGLDYFYSDLSVLIKIAVMLVVLGISLWVILSTRKGQDWLMFVKLAMVELSKVTWPERPDLMQTTLVVVIFVSFSAFLLWAMDAVLASLVRYLSF